MPQSTNKPLKLLMLTSSYPRNKEDSASIFLHQLAENVSKHGINVHVLAPADKKRETFIEGDVKVHRFHYLPLTLRQLAYGSGILNNLKYKPWLWIEVPFFVLMMTCSLLWLLWKERPHLIHAHWILPQGLVAVLAKRLFKVPVVTTAHGSDAFALRGRLMTRLKRLVVRKSDIWTSNSRATANAVGELPSLPRPHIIPMGVDIRYFQGGQRANLRRELQEDTNLLLFVGRLVEKKGVDDLLRALTLLPSGLGHRTSLWVVGDGEYRTRFQQHAETLGIEGRVRFWGQISNYLLPDFYAAADLFIAPSLDAEGQGVVLLEASAARLCVLATRVDGITEVVEDGHTGLLVEPRNPRQLAHAITKLLSDHKLRYELANNAFTKAQLYDWQKIAQDFEDLYRAVL